MRKRWAFLVLVAVLIMGYGCYTMFRPLPTAQFSVDIQQPAIEPLSSSQLDMNRDLSAVGYIDPNNQDVKCRPLSNTEATTTPRSTASLAKLITVQVVLDKHPLKAGEDGPIITIGENDVNLYYNTINNGGSSLPVTLGDQFTERQMIEGILLASANNLADSLAIWTYGSLENYQQAATEWLAKNNLTTTQIGSDASGYSPDTKSTAVDLCQIMLLATKQPALVEIMSQAEATMPDGSIIHNTNQLLGADGIFAGKTGFTEEAGHGVALASQQTIDGVTLTTAATSLGNDDYEPAFNNAHGLLASLQKDIKVYKLPKQTSIGKLTTVWGSQSNVVTTQSNTIPHWPDEPLAITSDVDVSQLSHSGSGNIIGKLTINGQQIPLAMASDLANASWQWRITHPLTRQH